MPSDVGGESGPGRLRSLTASFPPQAVAPKALWTTVAAMYLDIFFKALGLVP